MKTKKLLFTLFVCFAFLSCTTKKETIKSSTNSPKVTPDYLTIKEATAYLKIPESVAPLNTFPGVTSKLPASFSPPYRSIEPIKLFDNLYFVGTTTVGSYIVDTGDGLVMLDTGVGDETAAIMVEGMKKLGLNPSSIKLILISHEHFDHYGGVQYFKKNVCPNAKVALSLVGWNMLQTVPPEWAYIGQRPQSVDIYLVDGMKIKVGSVIFQVVATPGHSPGCVSFIFPVTDNGEKHVAGIMGGSAVWPIQDDMQLYKTSIEYFKAFAQAAKCDVGLNVHSTERDFAQLRTRKRGYPNPMVIGQDKFDTVYLKRYRDRYLQMLNSGKFTPYLPL
jgi:metallo-beta-lactamase class B